MANLDKQVIYIKVSLKYSVGKFLTKSHNSTGNKKTPGITEIRGTILTTLLTNLSNLNSKFC